jgi:hypothetical protein
VSANRAPVLTKLSEAEVSSIFGDALSALPPAPSRFTVFFRFESDALTDQSQALIPKFWRRSRSMRSRTSSSSDTPTRWETSRRTSGSD